METLINYATEIMIMLSLVMAVLITMLFGNIAKEFKRLSKEEWQREEQEQAEFMIQYAQMVKQRAGVKAELRNGGVK